jgi:hypothetical protein
MRLQVQVLTDVCSVNSFVYSTEAKWTTGDPVDVYVQLYDADKSLSQYGFYPAGLRYMPPATSTLQVTFQNIDDLKVVTRYATQPYAQDPSIWKISLLATDPISGTVNVKFVLTEPSGNATITKTTSIRAAFVAGIN